MIIRGLLAGLLLTAALSAEEQVRFVTLELRWHWEPPELFLVQVAQKKSATDVKKQTPRTVQKGLSNPPSSKIKPALLEPQKPPRTTYRRIA